MVKRALLQSEILRVVQADLAKQPWFAAAGVIEGEARLANGVAQSPAVEFRLRARDVVCLIEFCFGARGATSGRAAALSSGRALSVVSLSD